MPTFASWHFELNIRIQNLTFFNVRFRMRIFGNHVIPPRFERVSPPSISVCSWCERRLKFASPRRGGRGDFLKSLPSHFSRSNAAGIPGAAACRASIRFFAAPCAQCQEVSRPEFTLTHSIRSFVRSARRFVRSTEGRAGFAAIFMPPPRVIRSPFCVSFLQPPHSGTCQPFTPEFWRNIIISR